MTEFTKKVIAFVGIIPRGKVATYAQIAALAGKPHASRGVAWILNSSSDTHALPWHRVINSSGRISFPPGSTNFRRQRQRLRAENVTVAANGRIALAEYAWSKRASTRRPRNTPRMFA